jgi:hypothetical protein
MLARDAVFSNHDQDRYVLVLYLDRLGSKSGIGAALRGRFRYSDLKEAASSGAADLWALNRLEAFLVGRSPEFWVCREDLRHVFMATYELRIVVEGCRQTKTRAVKVAASAGRVCMPGHGVSSWLKVLVYAARSCVHGGDRASSWAGVSRSISCMVPPQCGHFGSVCGRVT